MLKLFYLMAKCLEHRPEVVVMDSEQMLSIADFAYQIGKSERQVRRYVQQGRLRVIETSEGARIARSESEAWAQFSGSDSPEDAHRPDLFRQKQPDEGSEKSGAVDEDSSATLGQALEVARLALRRSESLELSLLKERELRELEQQARAQTERRFEALTVELTGYRRALGEQAESLAEERARRLTLELAQQERLTSEAASATPVRGWSWRRWLGLKTS